MSREHILPDRWAELQQGALDATEVARLESHAASCVRCRTVRERVTSASRVLEELRQAPSPELNWDLLGARLTWVISSELRRHEREREHRRGWARRLFPFALGGAVMTLDGQRYWPTRQDLTPEEVFRNAERLQRLPPLLYSVSARAAESGAPAHDADVQRWRTSHTERSVVRHDHEILERGDESGVRGALRRGP